MTRTAGDRDRSQDSIMEFCLLQLARHFRLWSLVSHPEVTRGFIKDTAKLVSQTKQEVTQALPILDKHMVENTFLVEDQITTVFINGVGSTVFSSTLNLKRR